MILLWFCAVSALVGGLFLSKKFLIRKESMRKCSIRKDVDAADADLVVQFALSMDCILEKIFSSLGKIDLLDCRLVSHRWNSNGTALLRKEFMTLAFHEHCLQTSHVDRKKTESLNRNDEDVSTRDLSTLLTLLKPNPSPSEGVMQSFPCSKFNFLSINPSDLTFPAFLNSHGPFIKELTVNYSETISEVSAMELVGHLLSNQLPNLHYLAIGLTVHSINWKNPPNPRFNSAPLLKTDPEFTEITDSLRNTNLNSNLRILKFGFQLSAKVFETIVQRSPNLREVILEEYFIPYLLEPVNRIYLLKKFHPRWCNYRGVEMYEKIALAAQQCQGQGQETPLNLRELILKGDDLRHLCLWKKENESRIATVISQLLKGSSESLSHLCWDNMNYFHAYGIKWPTVMPKVRMLTLSYKHEGGNSEGGLFPPGFNLSRMFPNLQVVVLCNESPKNTDILYFIRSLNFEPVQSVKHVQINTPRVQFTRESISRLAKLFPNASNL